MIYLGDREVELYRGRVLESHHARLGRGGHRRRARGQRVRAEGARMPRTCLKGKLRTL